MEGNTYTSLKNRFDTDEEKIAAVKAMLGTKHEEGSDAPVDAYSSQHTVYSSVKQIEEDVALILSEVRAARTNGVNNQTERSLYLHLYNIDTLVDSINAEVSTIIAATGVNDNNEPIPLATRINELIALKTEVEAAHRAVAEGASPDTLA
jgi:hypothetical protein